MTQVITIGNATVNADLFDKYYKKAMEELTAEAKAKEDASECGKDFKETVEALALATKLPKPELTKYLKDRFAEFHVAREDDAKAVGTKVVINRGELYTLLNSALEK